MVEGGGVIKKIVRWIDMKNVDWFSEWLFEVKERIGGWVSKENRI